MGCVTYHDALGKSVRPFGDGHGRTARLLMNLVLIRGGYPPVAVRPADRKPHLDALEHASATDDRRPFQLLMHERLDATWGVFERAREAIMERQ